MTTTERHLLSLAIAALASLCAPVFAQSLSLSYQLDANAHAQRASIANAGCAAFRWIASVGSCGKTEALGRFSRQVPGDQALARFAPASQSSAAPSPRREADEIPYLGESTRTAGHDARSQTEPEVSMKIGERLRVREDIERRYTDAAQESRFKRNIINALGLEIMVPIHSKLHQSADPAIPQSAPY